MEIEIVDSIEKLLAYKSEWEEILRKINNEVVFLEPDWILIWWKFFGLKHKLFVLIAVNNQEVVGICPLMIKKNGVCNEIGFIGGRQSSNMKFILKDDYKEAALVCMLDFLRNLGGMNIIRFNTITEGTVFHVLLEKYLNANNVPMVCSKTVHYFINLGNKDFDTYFKYRFSNKTRQTMNSKEKKLKRLGNLVYRKITHDEIKEVFEIHEKRWLRKIGNSSFSKGKVKEFYKELIFNKNSKFNTTIDALTLNNKIISFIYGLNYGGRVLLIRIAHDDDFCSLSPGELIWRKKIEECFLTSQASVIDFGPGYEPYKANWTDDYEKVLSFMLPSSNLQSNLIFYIRYLTRVKLVNAIKGNKKIYNFRKYYLGKLKFSLSRTYISNEISKIRRSVNQNGLLLFMKKHICDFVNKIYSNKQYLVLGRYLRQVELPQINLQVKAASIDDLEALSEVMNESSSRIVRRLANNYRCYITVCDGEIIQYCWINPSYVEFSGKELAIPFASSDVYMYDTFIDKKFMNEYDYIHILTNIFNLLYKAGYRRCYIMLRSCNKSYENGTYLKIFHPRYKVVEKKIFNSINHYIVDLKLADKLKVEK